VPSGAKVNNVPLLIPSTSLDREGFVLKSYVPLAEANTCGRGEDEDCADRPAAQTTMSEDVNARVRVFMSALAARQFNLIFRGAIGVINHKDVD
jgi:hypothetical protein